jgi:tetratricopeptide (TPR) repeat protein
MYVQNYIQTFGCDKAFVLVYIKSFLAIDLNFLEDRKILKIYFTPKIKFQMDQLNVSITEISKNESNLQSDSQGEKHYKEALLLQDSSKFRASIEHFDKAIHFNFDLENSYLSKGFSLLQLEKYDDAIECFDKSLEINPNCAQAYNQKGAILCFIYEKNEEGKKLFKKASEFPCNSNSWKELLDKAQSLSFLDKNDEALKFINKSIIIKPNAWAYKIKADIMWELNKETEAIEWYNKALNFNRNYFMAYYAKGDRLKRIEQFKDAIESFDKAIQLNPISRIYRLRAESYAELNENEKAVQSYINAIALNPEDEESRNAMNEILEKQ